MNNLKFILTVPYGFDVTEPFTVSPWSADAGNLMKLERAGAEPILALLDPLPVVPERPLNRTETKPVRYESPDADELLTLSHA